MKQKYAVAVGFLVASFSMPACCNKLTKEPSVKEVVDKIQEKKVDDNKLKSTAVEISKEASTVSENTAAKKETLPSGLSFIIVKAAAADAKAPTKGSKIEVHYTGWLDKNGALGNKFDSSVDRGFPFKFNVGVGQVIAGWDEGVMLMKVGEKRRFFIPSKLGYGAYGAGNVIPPNADLIFDVEVLAV